MRPMLPLLLLSTAPRTSATRQGLAGVTATTHVREEPQPRTPASLTSVAVPRAARRVHPRVLRLRDTLPAGLQRRGLVGTSVARAAMSICMDGAPCSVTQDVDTLFLREGGKRLGELRRLANPLDLGRQHHRVCVSRIVGLAGAGAGRSGKGGDPLPFDIHEVRPSSRSPPLGDAHNPVMRVQMKGGPRGVADAQIERGQHT